MNTYNFSLVLGGISSRTPLLEDKLYNAGCDDALICFYGSTVYLQFDREAAGFQHAVLSAIQQVESLKGCQVTSVDAGGYVGISDIAERTGLTKQSISLLKEGKRGNGNFPSPLYRLTGKQPLWQWSEVAEWLASYEKIPKQLAAHAELVSNLNLALQLRDKTVRAKVGELMEALPNKH
ncbi:hypothetical protein AWR38_09355 [Idiomarina sp. WRN-38]|uniref:helix-turn-helix transcriptional regulator n=1 Tax=Idiomarina sp. OXR-189 TaxID=3100175 RepID=UPI0007336853|nr:hypothetical protein [Idiomarina sp. OXR-189]KTG24190.1 hypothetical protein AUR68_09340 [Idiomarina sp. H105]OAE91581.1 hypothetical protein AWR38_09355 [Idiomarina sp. WRN-38]WPZ02076.1 hypothetical protein UM402_03995 [Idiomarina sp. OXR-189]